VFHGAGACRTALRTGVKKNSLRAIRYFRTVRGMQSTHHQDLAQLAASAIEAAGGSAKLSRAIGRTLSTVNDWKKSRVPAAHLPRVAQLSGQAMEAIRPDLFAEATP
jgi:DNA-binding transcriptional regulator YdaS (Cro superfamily)